MSIPNIFDKIKVKASIDRMTIVYLCIIVGVGLSSFGLGRLSVVPDQANNDPITITNEPKSALEGGNTTKEVNMADRRYVASKNGKMYYSPNCSGAKRIKIENQIWFSTKEDAEKSGFTLSSTCN